MKPLIDEPVPPKPNERAGAATPDPPFFRTLTFKIGILIVLVQIIALSVTGGYYIHRFHLQIDDEMRSRLTKPTDLLAHGTLSLDSVENEAMMNRVIGGDLLELVDALVIGANGNIFHSLRPEQVGKDVSEIPILLPPGFALRDADGSFQEIYHEGMTYLITVAPLVAVDGRTPFTFVYFRIDVDGAEQAKAEITWLFTLGSAVIVLLTSGIIMLSFRSTITLRLEDMLSVLKKVEGGDLTTRIPERASRDEIDLLRAGLNSMTDHLETTLESLRDSEEKYRLLFSKERDSVILVDAENGEFLDVNEAALTAYGYTHDEFLERNVLDVVAPRSETVTRATSTIMDAFSSFSSHQRKDGKTFPIEMSSGAFVWRGRRVACCVIRDITQRMRAQAALARSETQLRQAQKMEAVGLLAGGIAHDFNNTLAVIRGYSEVLLNRETSPDVSVISEVKEIDRAAHRAAELTQKLLAFSRQQTLRPVVVELNQVIAELRSMLNRLVREDIEFVDALEDDLGHVKVDRAQLEQVLINLVLNATDAIEGGGTITIETANVELIREQVPANSDLAPGAYVLVSVTDDGSGMDEETRSHIFEPFFTSKAAGRGTGLGLSTAYGIVKQSGGNISVTSKPGRGTTFEIVLPRVAQPVNVGTESPSEAPGGGESVLLVEDDEDVRRLIRRILTSLGYTVLEATDGSDALEKFEERSEDLRLIITDVVMPHMNGRRLVERVRERDPEVKVLFLWIRERHGAT